MNSSLYCQWRFRLERAGDSETIARLWQLQQPPRLWSSLHVRRDSRQQSLQAFGVQVPSASWDWQPGTGVIEVASGDSEGEAACRRFLAEFREFFDIIEYAVLEECRVLGTVRLLGEDVA